MTQAHDGPEDDKPMPLLDHLIELRKRLIYALIAFIVAAVLTPPDVISQLALAIPLLGFYEISIIIGSWIEKKREEEEKKAEAAADG